MAKKPETPKGTEAAKRTKQLDMNAAYLGVTRRLLMENAGREVARTCAKYSRIAVFAGCGNNGGDGLVAARHLSSQGKEVAVYAVSGKRTKEAEASLDIVRKLESIELRYIKDSSDCAEIGKELEKYDAVIDALLGVGAAGEMREPIKTIVKMISSAKAYKVSVDIPTPGVKADLTLSLHYKKTDDAKVAGIGIPKEAETECGPGDVYAALPAREGFEHKGDFGRLLVVAGSREFSGTAMLVARAAARTGVDLITIASPTYVAGKISDPTMIVKPLDSEYYLSDADVDAILETNFDSMVIGNGIGTKDETRSFVEEIIRKVRKPVVVDADALKLLEVKTIRENHILTPHATEFRILFDRHVEDFKDRVGMVEEKAGKTRATIILKGPIDIVSSGAYTKLNKTGNPGMTVGGTGDVLAGIVGALSTKAESFQAACAGTFLSGLAGDISRDKLGYCFTAADVAENIPEAIKFCKQFE